MESRHKLKIVSLSDAQADCSCGWHFCRTGEATKKEIQEEFNRHLPKKENKITKSMMKKALKAKTGCAIQHTGWTCGTCFFSMSKELDNADWQALLVFRGDYDRKTMDNLPKDEKASIRKIYRIATENRII